MQSAKAENCAVALLVAAACNTACRASDAISDGQLPIDLPLRIVVSERAVRLYMDARDLGDCGCSAVRFPTVDACSFLTDANPCSGSPFCESCITDIGVEVNGERLTPTAYGGRDPLTRYYETFPSGQLTLVLAGCGHPTTRISLDAGAFLESTATADYVDGVPRVRWTTDAPALSTLLTLYSGSHGDLCHVQDVAEYSFAGWTSANSVTVQPLDSRVDIDTDFGPATVWWAGTASAIFPTPP
jgi:hypothetical protein